MKYIDRINSFWDYATMNPLSTGQVSLYFALLHICNRSYWTEWFQAPNQVLSILTGLSRSGILKARNELKQRNLIDFKERGTKGTLYKLMVLDNVQDDAIANSTQDSVQDSTQNGVQNSTQDSVQDSTIANSTQDSVQNSMRNGVQDSTQAIYSIYNNIHNKDKRQKTEDKRQISLPSIGHFEEFWSAYPKRQRRTLTEKAYCDLVLSKTVTEESLVKSAENYAEYIKIKGVRGNLDMCYLPNNFLKDRVFEDFLPENYQKPECTGVSNSATNLTQSQVEQIEKLSQERNTVKNEHPLEVMY